MKKNTNGTSVVSEALSSSTEPPVENRASKRSSSKASKIEKAFSETGPALKPKKRGKEGGGKAGEVADATRPLDPTLVSAVAPENDVTDPLLRLPVAAPADPLIKLDQEVVAGKTVAPRVLTCQQVECAYASDVGQVRSNNEDNLSAFMALVPGYAANHEILFGFFVVADGMGGYERGEVASQLAVRTATTQAIEQVYLKAIAGEALGGAGETLAETLMRIIADANNIVAHEASRERNTMGTTLVCALLVANTIYIGHIGDSRLYAIRRATGALEQLTTDHSVVQRLVDTGQMTVAEAAVSPKRSVLYRSLGQFNTQPADTSFIQVSDYSHLMLCSDGLWDMVDDETIGKILRESKDAETSCRRLLNAANQNGGEDNVSAIVVKLAN